MEEKEDSEEQGFTCLQDCENVQEEGQQDIICRKDMMYHLCRIIREENEHGGIVEADVILKYFYQHQLYLSLRDIRELVFHSIRRMDVVLVSGLLFFGPPFLIMKHPQQSMLSELLNNGIFYKHDENIQLDMISLLVNYGVLEQFSWRYQNFRSNVLFILFTVTLQRNPHLCVQIFRKFLDIGLNFKEVVVQKATQKTCEEYLFDKVHSNPTNSIYSRLLEMVIKEPLRRQTFLKIVIYHLNQFLVQDISTLISQYCVHQQLYQQIWFCIKEK